MAPGAEPVKVLREAWTAVLRYDYEPVFRPALDVLEALAAADALRANRRPLTDAASPVNSLLSLRGRRASWAMVHPPSARGSESRRVGEGRASGAARL